MSTTNTVSKQDRDKYKNDKANCPDNEQIAVEILAQLNRKGVTVKHKITGENTTAEKITSNNTEPEIDKNYLFGPEDGFGEDNDEEAEINTNNREVESILLQSLKSPDTTSEEENDEDEILVEDAKHGSSIANINQMLNSSSFQRQHRFDLQTNKNSANNNIKPAQVTIQIIPHNINLQMGNNDQDELLGLELHNFAAIIQDLDSTIKQRPQLTLSTVHATASNDKNNTNVAQINMGEKDTDRDLQPNVNALMREELHYINGTFAYNQSQHVNAANNTEIHDTGIPVARNNEGRKNYLSHVSHVPDASAISLLTIKQQTNENLPTTANKENRSSDVNHLSENILLTNHSSDTSSHSGQTFNISEKPHTRNDVKISLTNITHIMLKNITQPNSNYTEVISEVQVPGPLKRLMELDTHNGKDNLTVLDFWRNLMAKKQLDKNDKNDTTMANNIISFSQNNSETQDTAWITHKPSILFSIDAIINMISAFNNTKDRNYDIQHHQYLSRLQELATELMNMKNGSALEITDHFIFTNATDKIKRTISEEGNK
jgi:hypothetical protein